MTHSKKKSTASEKNLLSFPSKGMVEKENLLDDEVAEKDFFKDLLEEFDEVAHYCNEDLSAAQNNTKYDTTKEIESGSIKLIQQQIKVIQEVNQRIKYYMKEIKEHTVRASK